MIRRPVIDHEPTVRTAAVTLAAFLGTLIVVIACALVARRVRGATPRPARDVASTTCHRAVRQRLDWPQSVQWHGESTAGDRSSMSVTGWLDARGMGDVRLHGRYRCRVRWVGDRPSATVALSHMTG
jgi:hypothetical protein